MKRYNKRVENKISSLSYCLLDLDDSIEVPEKIREKIIFKSVSGNKNPVNDVNNSINDTQNPKSKVKKRKGK